MFIHIESLKFKYYKLHTFSQKSSILICNMSTATLNVRTHEETTIVFTDNWFRSLYILKKQQTISALPYSRVNQPAIFVADIFFVTTAHAPPSELILASTTFPFPLKVDSFLPPKPTLTLNFLLFASDILRLGQLSFAAMTHQRAESLPQRRPNGQRHRRHITAGAVPQRSRGRCRRLFLQLLLLL